MRSDGCCAKRERQRRSTIRTSARSSKSVRADGRAFIAMQLHIDGETLMRVCAGRRSESARDALAIARPDRRCPERRRTRTASCIATSSPSNIMVTSRGHARGSWISALPSWCTRTTRHRMARPKRYRLLRRQRRRRWHGSVYVAGAGARRNAATREAICSALARCSTSSSPGRRPFQGNSSAAVAAAILTAGSAAARAVCPEHAAQSSIASSRSC